MAWYCTSVIQSSSLSHAYSDPRWNKCRAILTRRQCKGSTRPFLRTWNPIYRGYFRALAGYSKSIFALTESTCGYLWGGQSVHMTSSRAYGSSMSRTGGSTSCLM